MTFLQRDDTKQDYLRQIKQLSKSSQKQTLQAIHRFDEFCKKEYSRAEKEILDELKNLKRTKSDDEYKKLLFSTLQLFVNDLSVIYDPGTLKAVFSFFKNYLTWNATPIYNKDIRVFLKFPKKSKEQKHVINKDEIKQISNVASLKRRMLYLVLCSSAMRIGETLQLRKHDNEVKNGQVTINLPPQYTKTKEGRSTFISQEAANFLIPHLEKLQENDLVFGINEDPNYSETSEEKSFSIYRKKVGFCNCDEKGFKI